MSYIRTKEHKEKMRLLNLGRRASKETKKKISLNHANVNGENNPMWGKKRPQYVKDAVSKANKGKRHNNYMKPMLGKHHSLKTKLAMSLAQTGENGSNWRGGLTEEHQIIRSSAKYKDWRIAVFIRDNWTCQLCYRRGGYLEADHIKPFSLYPKLRFEIDNGRTLCKKCHKTTDSYGFKLKWHRDNVSKLPEEKVFITSNGL